MNHVFPAALSYLSNMTAFSPMLTHTCVFVHFYDLSITAASGSVLSVAYAVWCIIWPLQHGGLWLSVVYPMWSLLHKWTCSTWRLLASVFCPMPRLLHYATSPTWRHLSHYAFCCIIRPLQYGELWSSIVWSMCSQLRDQIFPTLLPSLAQCRMHTFCYLRLWH